MRENGRAKLFGTILLVETIEFKSKDGLLITADDYLAKDAKNTLLLCHRSHFNRGEYKEIAPKLNKLDFNCIAIDQRSGMEVLGTTNETYNRAKQEGKATGYMAAKPDIEAAIDYAFVLSQNQPIILIGSSYSASLALLIASEGNKKVKAVVAFSPGEYLKGVNLAHAIKDIKIPTLILSSKKEIGDTTKLIAQADPLFVKQYKPKGEGAHGARVLWSQTQGNEEYWTALEVFLVNG